MKKIIVFILISLFLNILSMEKDSNMTIVKDSTKNELELSHLQEEGLIPILSEFESYVNQIKSANDIFEFYNFFDQEKNAELSNMRLTGKLFNIIIADMYLKTINDKFEELKAKAIADCKDKSKEDLNKELQDIFNLELFREEEKLRECCKLILAGADVDLEIKYGDTALSLAAWTGDSEVVKLLLGKNANIDIQDAITSRTALMNAARMGRNEIVKLLLDKNANIDLQDCTDCTALMDAVGEGHNEIVKLLLDKNANIDLQDDSGRTALMHAANKGYIEIVRLLLDRNVDTNIRDNGGETALMYASYKGYNEIADLLRNKNS